METYMFGETIKKVFSCKGKAPFLWPARNKLFFPQHGIAIWKETGPSIRVGDFGSRTKSAIVRKTQKLIDYLIENIYHLLY